MTGRLSVFVLALTLCASATAAADVPVTARALDAQERQREQDRAAALAQAQEAKGELVALNAQLAELNHAQQTGDATISDKRLKLAALNAQENELEQQLGAERAESARLLAVLEMLRREPPPALFVDPHDVKAAVRAAILIRAITPELEARADGLKAQAEALKAARRQAATASEDLFITESGQAQRRAEIETLIARKTALEQKSEADARQADADIAALAARARALRALTQGVAAAGSAHPPDPEHAGLFGRPKAFVAPVAGDPVTRFGAPLAGSNRSEGWTWQAQPRAVVDAPADGAVDYAGPLKGWGIVVILRLGGDYQLVLAGLDTASVRPGQAVAAGAPVGRMAGPGQPTDLYFEIRKSGAVVDPAQWIAAQRP